MPDANSTANDFVTDHPLLLRLPKLIGDTTGIIAVSITLAFETVTTFSVQLEHSSVVFYRKSYRCIG